MEGGKEPRGEGGREKGRTGVDERLEQEKGDEVMREKGGKY